MNDDSVAEIAVLQAKVEELIRERDVLRDLLQRVAACVPGPALYEKRSDEKSLAAHIDEVTELKGDDPDIGSWQIRSGCDGFGNRSKGQMGQG